MRTKSYNTRPPDTAREAQRAWDYFMDKRKFKLRTIKELFYSRWCDFTTPSWICEWSIIPGDTDHWAFSTRCLTDTAAVSQINYWAKNRTQTTTTATTP